MKTEELAFVLRCQSALGTDLDLRKMTSNFLNEVVRGSIAIGGSMRMNNGLSVQTGKTMDTSNSVAYAPDSLRAFRVTTEDDGTSRLQVDLKNGSLELFFKSYTNRLNFYGNAIAGLSKRIDTSIEACLNHAELEASKKKVEHAYKLLEAVSYTTELLLDNSNYISALSEGLPAVGKAIGVDRVYFFENDFVNGATSSTSQRVEWTANGIKPEIDNPDLQQVPFEEFPEMVEPLEKGKEFCGWVKELPSDKTRTLLESQNIRSILVLPVMASKRFIGFLGYDDCTNYRTWTVEEKSVLQALCSSLGRSLQGAAVQKELKQAQVKLEELNASLEEKVKERTAELDNTLAELKIAQDEIVQQEKLAVLGKLAAGVAHEMNTPLGAITSSADNLTNILRAMFKDGLEDADHAIIKEACKLADDFTAHDTLTSRQERIERLALTEYLRTEYDLGPKSEQHARALVECGVLTTDKEILEHIYRSSNVEMALNITTTIMKVRKSVSTIEVAAQKAANVVRALKSYVRNDNVYSATVFDVRRSINDMLLLFSNQLKKGVELHLDMETQLLLQGNESELSKVWSNLIANALYAMQYRGNLWITGRADHKNIILTFSNDGPAIPEEVMAKLFEPFYTTKPVGEGSGMGLSMVFNIVASMHGSIEAETGDRTTFTVTIPKQHKPL